jgi:glutamine cyclotransferase
VAFEKMNEGVCVGWIILNWEVKLLSIRLMRILLLTLVIATILFSCLTEITANDECELTLVDSRVNQKNDSLSPAVVQKPTPSEETASLYSYKIKHTWPHDRKAYTQGLIYQDGILWESTGQYGASSLRKVELKTGRVLQKISVPEDYFAEA